MIIKSYTLKIRKQAIIFSKICKKIYAEIRHSLQNTVSLLTINTRCSSFARRKLQLCRCLGFDGHFSPASSHCFGSPAGCALSGPRPLEGSLPPALLSHHLSRPITSPLKARPVPLATDYFLPYDNLWIPVLSPSSGIHSYALLCLFPHCFQYFRGAVH